MRDQIAHSGHICITILFLWFFFGEEASSSQKTAVYRQSQRENVLLPLPQLQSMAEALYDSLAMHKGEQTSRKRSLNDGIALLKPPDTVMYPAILQSLRFIA